MTSDIRNMSIAHWFSGIEQHRCGYCKNENGSISNGMWAETLTVEDYQDLIDRGWRRSGKYCYKPIMTETCCPQYTIKCDAQNISLSKSQKKVIKKFNKYLEDDILNKKDITPEAQGVDGHDSSTIIIKDRPNINFSKIDNKSEVAEINQRVEKDSMDISLPNSSRFDKNMDEDRNERGLQIEDNFKSSNSSPKNINMKTPFKEGIGKDASKPPCKKAKLLRRERKEEKLLKRGLNLEKKEPTQTQKTLEQFLEDVSKSAKHNIRLELVPTSEPSITWERVKEVEFELYRKYQMIVHNDPPTKLSMKGFSRFLVNSPLKISIERMSPDHELFAVSAELFQKYQMSVHNDTVDDCNEEQFFSFLVQTPLKSWFPQVNPISRERVKEPVSFPSGIDGPGYGSFHQQYWIDDKLVAVGVIDILPRCVSSVYFFYDPDYRNLTLGTYGALREVEFTRSLHKKIPELRNYYMGFYIHSCQKMRYKGKLVPSFLLCPETYRWIPIERCIEKLDASKYSRLEDDIDAIDENYPTSREIGEIKVVYDYKLMYVRDYKRFRKEQSLFNQIGELVGRKCAKSIVFCIN